MNPQIIMEVARGVMIAAILAIGVGVLKADIDIATLTQAVTDLRVSTTIELSDHETRLRSIERHQPLEIAPR